ncbi:MAG: hypothetical protein KBT27_14775 [Prevotellaceae bacterium]|nr:hypothetical protein [Candidatus Faecinaster equi]
MNRLLSFIFITFACLSLISCDSDEGSNETRAGIIAEDFVKQDVISPNDLDFDLVGVDKEGTDEYHAVANIKTLNGLGMKVPRKVSVRLKYNGAGDWADINNWTKISISYINEATGEMQTSYGASKDNSDDGLDVFNDASEGEVETINGIKFNVMFKNEYTENLASDKKLTKEQVKSVCNALKGKDVYFYVNGATESLADCYANMIGGHLDYDNK